MQSQQMKNIQMISIARKVKIWIKDKLTGIAAMNEDTEFLHMDGCRHLGLLRDYKLIADSDYCLVIVGPPGLH